jgi:hypothetical protein
MMMHSSMEEECIAAANEKEHFMILTAFTSG